MGAHEEFLELCAAATAGELSRVEQERLQEHLAGCAECRKAMREYEVAARKGIAALAEEFAPKDERADGSFGTEAAENAFFERLDREKENTPSAKVNYGDSESKKSGQRFTYRPSQIRWKEIWMPFAAAALLAVALGIATYRAGVKRGTDAARMLPQPVLEPVGSLEEQASDAGYERTQLKAKLTENAKVIEDLKRKLSDETKIVDALMAKEGSPESSAQVAHDSPKGRDDELAAAQRKLTDLQKALESATAKQGEASDRAAVLEAKVNELSQLMRDREQALDQKEIEVAKQQELLAHDRDVRELMGARELYMADIHDVSGKGTDKTYGRVFYTKGKSLIVYAFDLDAQPGVQNASTFQAWGRRGPDKQQALSLGIFYEDNVSKKRWVLKANDPKTLEDIDAVFVTVEPNGGSHHPSGKQLLFAYLRVSPNHP